MAFVIVAADGGGMTAYASAWSERVRLNAETAWGLDGDAGGWGRMCSLVGSAGKAPEGDRAEVVGGTCGLTLSMKLPVSARARFSFDDFGRSCICGLVGRRHCSWSLLGSLSWYLWGSWKCSPRTTDGF